ncbi:YceD family protein [Flectobacillus rivi]|uniref:DUF177 domain-containing protein n=1 Tax=Flectobacillus rivi TaxID=2984209 RepID=A0ABT6Z3Z2_9BACT|nr:DUF177 domain-containing protein [Flectobacillus rivi]MDI9875840.1 DUF177 domain-containing protein [Flectobacillus rivi]
MKKNYLANYKVDIFRLENKQYVLEFEGDNQFFAEFEQDEVGKGNFKAKVTLDKSETMIQLLYEIEAVVELTCDRSLELFDYPISITKKMILKFADRTEEVTDELMLIDRHVQQINVAQDIFDFIFLEIPIKRLHPKFVQEEEVFDEDDEDDEDWDDDDLLWEDEEGEFVYTTGGGDDDDEEEEEYDEVEEEESSEDDSEAPIDPRWAILKNLKNNQN